MLCTYCQAWPTLGHRVGPWCSHKGFFYVRVKNLNAYRSQKPDRRASHHSFTKSQLLPNKNLVLIVPASLEYFLRGAKNLDFYVKRSDFKLLDSFFFWKKVCINRIYLEPYLTVGLSVSKPPDNVCPMSLCLWTCYKRFPDFKIV